MRIVYAALSCAAVAAIMAAIVFTQMWRQSVPVPALTPAPTPTVAAVEAESLRDRVFLILNPDSLHQQLPLFQRASLTLNQGVDVQERGQARLYFSDLLTVDVLRNGNLIVQELSINEQSALITVLQNAGALLHDFHPKQEIERRLVVETQFARIVATGTRFLVAYEQDTPLAWVVALDALTNDLTVQDKDIGATDVLATGLAAWLAPIGRPGAPIVYKQQAFADWVVRVQNGEPQLELGDVLWDPADVVTNTSGLAPQLQPSLWVDVDQVHIKLDPAVLTGAFAYQRRDCNSDGIQDIAIDNGKLTFDFRQLPYRVRALDVTLYSPDGISGSALGAFNPAYAEVDRTVRVARDDEWFLLSVRSDQRANNQGSEDPYHYAELTLNNACLLGYSLTPPKADGSPGDPRWAVTPPPTPVIVPTATSTITPTITPTDTPSPTMTPSPTRQPPLACVVAPPAHWVAYRVQPGDTLSAIAARTGTSWQQLMTVSCLPSETIRVGQVLYVPYVAPPPSPCPVLGVALNADPGRNTVTLAWTVSGGCDPIVGRLTGSYDSSYEDSGDFGVDVTTRTGGHIVGPLPLPTCEGAITYNLAATITVGDRSGQQASASIDAEFDLGCEPPTEETPVTVTSVPTDTLTPVDTPVPTDTPTVTNTPTNTETPTPIYTDTPTVTNTPTNTETPTPIYTDTPTVTNTPTNTDTPTPIYTDVPTVIHTPTETPTPTPTDGSISIPTLITTIGVPPPVTATSTLMAPVALTNTPVASVAATPTDLSKLPPTDTPAPAPPETSAPSAPTALPADPPAVAAPVLPTTTPMPALLAPTNAPPPPATDPPTPTPTSA